MTEDANADEMSSASEDRVRASVDALTAALGLDVRHRLTQTLASASTTMLGKMISRYDVTKVAVTQTRRVLSERADDAEAFGRAYDALKTLRVEELDRYLAVVAKIAMDEELAFAVSEAGGRVAAAEGAAGVTSAARGLDYDGDANANATKSHDDVYEKKKVATRLAGLADRTHAMLAEYPGRESRFVKHVDNTARDGRRLTVLCYLNEDWLGEHGGALKVYDLPEGTRSSGLNARAEKVPLEGEEEDEEDQTVNRGFLNIAPAGGVVAMLS